MIGLKVNESFTFKMLRFHSGLLVGIIVSHTGNGSHKLMKTMVPLSYNAVDDMCYFGLLPTRKDIDVTYPVLEHTAQGCPAYPYCEALKAYGIPLSSNKDCLFDFSSGNPVLAAGAKRAIEASDKKDIVQALAEEATRMLQEYSTYAAKQEKALTLLAQHEDLFAARMDLWRAMIDAARSERVFTDIELVCYESRITNAKEKLAEAEAEADKQAQEQALAAHDRRLKDDYLLQFDEAMVADINRMVSNILNVRPTLVVGDKGIAKTQIAKFVMGLYGSDPIVVSVKGDMMSDELIGKIKHDPKRNTFVFKEGILLNAMRKGIPVLLDEINFGDQAIIARLQDILLRRPGEKVFVQESGEDPVLIKPGFVVFATANEASLRYRHREILDPAIRDRFDIVIRNYPDLDGDPLLDTPHTLLRLAISSAVDRQGVLSRHIDRGFLESFVRLAHITQYLYAVPAKDVTLELVDDRMRSVVMEEAQPLMTDCITPRTMSNTIADCAAGNLPDRRFDAALLDRLIRSLDQAGSSYNYELAQQVKLMLDLSSEAGEDGRDGA